MDVTAFARGWLDLIESSERGRGISTSADFLQPTVDIMDLLGANKRKLLVQPHSIVATGGTVMFNVPFGEVWRVHYAALSFVVPAASSITDLHLLVVPPENYDAASAGGSIPVTSPQTYGPTPDGDVIWDAGKILLTPGTGVGYTSGAAVGLPFVAAFRCYFERFLV